MSFDLAQIVPTLKKYAEEYSIETYPSEHRNHLGSSIIGDPCARKIWYTFRWVKLIQHDPRMRRLFSRGHKEEPYFTEFLRWAGFSMRHIDPDTGKQYRLSGVEGHYGGSTDGICLIRWADNLPVIVEFKTHNNKSFEKLKVDGVKKSKPQHWAQMCSYGNGFKVNHGLYCAVNKDTDEWHFEFHELDLQYGMQLEKKASDIITCKTPPARISDNPSFMECTFCDFKKICHHNEPVEINCRSCKVSEPIADGKWKCNRFNSEIPKEFIPKGCEQHLSVNI